MVFKSWVRMMRVVFGVRGPERQATDQLDAELRKAEMERDLAMAEVRDNRYRVSELLKQVLSNVQAR
jgi:hypothetical protein